MIFERLSVKQLFISFSAVIISILLIIEIIKYSNKSTGFNPPIAYLMFLFFSGLLSIPALVFFYRFLKGAQFFLDDKYRTKQGKIYREEYLTSPEWKQKCIKKLNSVGWRCESCGRGKEEIGWLDVHHKTYDTIPNENIDRDLQVLCRSCHEEAHGRHF